jgi:RNA polymerase sigma-70 factor (ECF subfamily)
MDVQERFARGDLSAFEAMFRGHQADVYRWCLRIVRDHAAAEDLAMDAFQRAWRSHATFDPGKSFGAWIRRIATNLALEHLRAAKRNVPLMIDRGGAVAGGGGDAQRDASRMAPDHEAAALVAAQAGVGVMRHVAVGGAAENPAMARERREQIAAAFAELSPKLRVVATLAIVEDLSYAEIADALGISEAAARVRAHRAMEHLREKLKHMRNG